MPLCTILPKCPAPFSPTQSQHGVPSSTLAAIAWNIGFTEGQAFFDPPGMIDGPSNAPSSPPETPVPIYNMPLLSTYAVLLLVSGKWVLPPSIIMSPGE